MHRHITRRNFLRAAAAGSAAVACLQPRAASVLRAATPNKPAVLGGAPVHPGNWPGWPSWRESWEPELLSVLRSGRWWRGSGQQVERFEKAYAELIGAKACLATASGTTALMVSLHVLGVDAGDEVIVSPFTFIATYNAILDQKALPVFADTDPDTFTVDPASVERRITDRTRAILPVHIYGLPCEMGPIIAIAKKYRLAVVEDACQAWLAQYKGQNCGVIGDLGCFSFQNSKHLPSGEGGAITGNDPTMIDRCHSYHNCGRARGSNQGSRPYFTRGGNYRMQEFQAVMLMQQFEKLQQETELRRNHAARLSKALAEIPGIHPARVPDDSVPVWHLFPFRYEPREFADLPRDKLLKALNAEGIPCGPGYHDQYFDGLLDETIESRGFKRLFSPQRLKDYKDSLHDLNGNARVCASTVTLTQNLLLASPNDIDHIPAALRRIQAYAAEITKQQP